MNQSSDQRSMLKSLWVWRGDLRQKFSEGLLKFSLLNQNFIFYVENSREKD